MVRAAAANPASMACTFLALQRQRSDAVLQFAGPQRERPCSAAESLLGYWSLLARSKRQLKILPDGVPLWPTRNPAAAENVHVPPNTALRSHRLLPALPIPLCRESTGVTSLWARHWRPRALMWARAAPPTPALATPRSVRRQLLDQPDDGSVLLLLAWDGPLV